MQAVLAIWVDCPAVIAGWGTVHHIAATQSSRVDAESWELIDEVKDEKVTETERAGTGCSLYHLVAYHLKALWWIFEAKKYS
jgi:hypothetical protein